MSQLTKQRGLKRAQKKDEEVARPKIRGRQTGSKKFSQ